MATAQSTGLRRHRVWQYDVLEQNGQLGLVIETPHQPDDPYAAPEENPNPLPPNQVALRVYGLSVPHRFDTDSLKIVDRGFTYGDVVTWVDEKAHALHGGATQSGYVTRVTIKVDVVFAEAMVITFAIGDRDIRNLFSLQGVDSRHFKPAAPLVADSVVCSKGWAGRTLNIRYDVIIQTASQTYRVPARFTHLLQIVLATPNPEETPMHYVGAMVSVPVRAWQQAIHIQGAHVAMPYPTYAVVAAVNLLHVDVGWVADDGTGRAFPAPRINLSRMRANMIDKLLQSPTKAFENDSFNIGDPVLVRDESPMVEHVQKLYEQARRFPTPVAPLTKGLMVTRTHSVVDVVWQDGSVSENIVATDLVYRSTIDDREFFPGNFVIEKSVRVGTNGSGDDDLVERVGVVLRQDVVERTCQVRWLEAFAPADADPAKAIEEIPVFQLVCHPEWVFAVGSGVFLRDRSAHSTDPQIIRACRDIVNHFFRDSAPCGPPARPLDPQASRQFCGTVVTVLPQGLVVVIWADMSYSAVPPDAVVIIDEEDDGGEEEEEQSGEMDQDFVDEVGGSWDDEVDEGEVVEDGEEVLDDDGGEWVTDDEDGDDGEEEEEEEGNVWGAADDGATWMDEEEEEEEANEWVADDGDDDEGWETDEDGSDVVYEDSTDMTEDDGPQNEGTFAPPQRVTGSALGDNLLAHASQLLAIVSAQAQRVLPELFVDAVEHQSPIAPEDNGDVPPSIDAAPAAQEGSDAGSRLLADAEEGIVQANRTVIAAPHTTASPFPTALRASGGSINTFLSLDSAPLRHAYYNPSPGTLPVSLTRRIFSEHSTLQSSLPSEGIMVRVFEDRMDLFQCMITGPVETPYEDVLFMFDLRLRTNYPATPPDVFFYSWTDGLGRVNPNLYEDGKVCLSILGTWNGNGVENWAPTSTVLRVLLSIQALVLVREPYYNEAGFERQVGTAEGDHNSRLYTENAFLIILRSIVYALRNPPPAFVEDIYCHYFTKGALGRILDRCKALIEGEEAPAGVKRVPDRLSRGARNVLAGLVRQLETARDNVLNNLA